MKILVTGATGFLGRRIVARLLEAGDDVRAFIRPGRHAPEGVEAFEGDLASRRDVERAMEGVEAAVHAGARVSTSGSWEEFRTVNVDATGDLINAAVRGGVRHVVHISSLSVYAVAADGACITEDSPYEDQAAERGFYSRSKLEADRLALEEMHRGAPLTVLRPGVLYGPGRVPPLGRQSFSFRSWRLILGSPAYLLPLSYVDNVADAIHRSLGTPGSRGRVYTIVDPQIRLREYLDLRREIGGQKWRPVFVPAAPVAAAAGIVALAFRAAGRNAPISPHQVRRATRSALYDCTRAGTELGWAPRYSLVEGLRRTLPGAAAVGAAAASVKLASYETT